MTSNITLFIPQLSELTVDKAQAELAQLLCYAKKKPQSTTLTTLLSCDHDTFPSAACRGWYDDMDTTQDFWICADPVTWQMDAKHVYMLGNQQLVLTETELNSLHHSLNEFLVDYQLTLHIRPENRWYLHSKKALDILTRDHAAIIGENIFSYLPMGNEKTFWRSLFTEIQMLLYQHPVNALRREQQQVTVDGLWFHGAGKLPMTIAKPKWNIIFSDNLAILGWAKLNELAYQQVDFSDFNLTLSDNCLLISSTIAPQHVDNKLFSALTKMVQNKHCQQIDLFDEETHYQLQLAHYPWWKRIFNG